MPEFDMRGREPRQPGKAKVGSQKTRKERVNDHEQDLADRLGGMRQPNSGALVQHKGDVILEKFLLDSKETEAAVINVTGHDLTKITREADGERKLPGLVLTIRRVPATVEKEWVCIPISVFARMLETGMDKEI